MFDSNNKFFKQISKEKYGFSNEKEEAFVFYVGNDANVFFQLTDLLCTSLDKQAQLVFKVCRLFGSEIGAMLELVTR